jgi:hypothetical protein
LFVGSARNSASWLPERHDHGAAGGCRLRLESPHQVDDGRALVALVDEIADRDRGPPAPRPGIPDSGIRRRLDEAGRREQRHEPVITAMDVAEADDILGGGAFDHRRETSPVARGGRRLCLLLGASLLLLALPVVLLGERVAARSQRRGENENDRSPREPVHACAVAASGWRSRRIDRSPT